MFANEIVLQFVHHLVCICAIASTALVVRGQHKEHLLLSISVPKEIFVSFLNIQISLSRRMSLTSSHTLSFLPDLNDVAHKCPSTY